MEEIRDWESTHTYIDLAHSLWRVWQNGTAKKSPESTKVTNNLNFVPKKEKRRQRERETSKEWTHLNEGEETEILTGP